MNARANRGTARRKNLRMARNLRAPISRTMWTRAFYHRSVHVRTKFPTRGQPRPRACPAAPVASVVKENCLDRSKDESDWLRPELEHATKSHRNIIPVMKDGFEFPPADQLPTSLVDLHKYHGLPYHHNSFSV